MDCIIAEVVALLRSDEFSARVKTMNLGAVANTPAGVGGAAQAIFTAVPLTATIIMPLVSPSTS